ncbi:type 1 fimbrial protein [Pseudomonas sp. ANT_J12]|jgi:major type 1 subunit fimbrin (pilin)|uniref:fimbrial protein n=1 Tax=Pseudomonas sp. ANT_J12 TaxID=2597351 RepID=UPI0011F0C667|nr:fimbrial protein [Pseudomonas sp. ANT_J12]KAA0983004.1 type 1 fimbrial protein [Pseudomonas sp. ANT_J12]
MKKTSLLALAIVAHAALSSSAFAASGTLQFNGELNNASCTVTPGGDASAGTGNNILVDMGDVSFADLQVASPGVGNVGVAVTDLNFDIGCPSGVGALSSVIMSFDPNSGSGLDSIDGRLLALSPGGASGAAIALVNSANDIIDMSSAPSISAPLDIDEDGVGTANIALRATYLRTSGAEVPGAANGSLPFVLRYE